MIKSLKKSINIIFDVLNVRKFEAFILMFFVCLYAVAEFGGIGMLMPVLQYINEGPDIYQRDNLSIIWKAIIAIINFLKLPINLFTLLVLAFVPILLRQLFYYLEQSYASKIQNRAIARMRKGGIKEFLESSLEFSQKHEQSHLISIMSIESQRAGKSISVFLQLASSIILILGYTIVLFLISPFLTMISVAFLFISIVFVIPLIWRSRKYGEEFTHYNRQLYKQVSEKIYGLRVIKMLCREKDETKQISKIINGVSDSALKADISAAKIITITEPLIILSIFGILYIASVYLRLSLSSIGVFLFLLLRLAPRVKSLTGQFQSITANFASLENLHTTIQEAKSYKSISRGSIHFKGLNKGIEFDKVSYSYYGSQSKTLAIKDLSFNIPSKSFTAIIGSSGAGKSTLADFIPRLRDATSGTIYIDGISINEYNLNTLRVKIGFLSQETFLFHDTIFNNICFGLNGKVMANKVELAAKRAYAHQFIIEMPDGYNTIIGDRGVRLSGGERQRVALARIMFQDPEIIIMDEYTSALDSESEMYIQKAMKDICRGKTMIIIAHRLATIKHAEQIIVLEKGELVDVGDITSMLENNESHFRRLFDSQMDF